MKSPLRKNMGEKNCELTPEIRARILDLFLNMTENEVSKIFPNEEFGYWNVTVERPLRLRVVPQNPIPEKALKPAERETVAAALRALPADTPLNDWNAFAKATKLKAALLKKIRPHIIEKDLEALPIDGEPDPDLRDTEIVPFRYEGGITAFMKNEVLPYAPDAWVDEKKTRAAYKLSFTKYFYKPVELRPLAEIIADLRALEAETAGLLDEVIGEQKE